jgi:hypothetical protein
MSGTDWSQDFSVVRLKAKARSMSVPKNYRPEVMRCECGFETRQTTEAWVHSWQHGKAQRTEEAA